MRLALLVTTTVVVVFAAPMGAQPPRDTVRHLADMGREALRLGARHGQSIWPGFRPDTIPISFVLPSRGDLLVGWRGALPAGYLPVADVAGVAWRDQKALSAASTATSVEGRSVAQVVVSSIEPAMLTATAIHEAFHVFQNSVRVPNRKFGQGENTILLSSYPVFSADNEAAFALEGRLLAAALRARTPNDKRQHAAEFVAVRRERHRRLASQFAEFDQLSELHEGLAQYALVRALRVLATEGPSSWRDEAERALASQERQLERITESENLSLRYRFYQTGPALGLLLDALAAPGWKIEMIRANSTLQDMLAVAAGIDAAAVAARATAERRMGGTALNDRINAQISALQAARRAKADSILSRDGVRLVLSADSLAGGSFNFCGYDPQNILQVSTTVQIQMRWWRPCAGGPTSAEFNVPSVFDKQRGRIESVIGVDADVRMTVEGQPIRLADGETLYNVTTFKLDAPKASVQAVRADVSRKGSVLTVYPKRPR